MATAGQATAATQQSVVTDPTQCLVQVVGVGRGEPDGLAGTGVIEAQLDRMQPLALQAEPGRRVWFCGSHAQAGIPLLESAVRSASEVAARLGAPLPGLAQPDQPLVAGRVADSRA